MTKDRKRLLAAWHNQRYRCNDPKNKDFKSYGKKGIRVIYTFKELERWFHTQEYKENFVIGRLDHEKNYCLENIRLETPRESNSERVARVPNPGTLRRKNVLIRDAKTNEKLMIAFGTHQAGRLTGVLQGNVHAAIKSGGVRNGYKFSYEATK